jgi:hypothetical protein
MSHVPKKKRREAARFPSHYDMPVSKVDEVKTTVGKFKIVVFNAGKDWAGKTEYEIEILYPDSDECGTSTKKFSSTSEAVSYGLRAIKEAVQKKVDEAKPKRRSKKPKQDLHDVAEERGWTFEWKDDPDGWDSLGDVDPDDVEEVLSVVMFNKDHEAIASLGGVAFAKRSSTAANQKYGREVEDELIQEALAHPELR